MSPPRPPVTVPITRPAFDEAEALAVAHVVRSGWIMQGPVVERFEQCLADYLGAPHVIAVANGTSALELALRALHIGPGDEVVTVSHSFIATANAILAVGATPVFVDIEPEGLGMDPAAAAAALSPRTRALLCVHQLGFACEMGGLLQLAARAGIPLVEDAACALGSEVLSPTGSEWHKLGRPHGVMACFSFHPRKVITTGEGGAITTRDVALAGRVRALRQHALGTVPVPRANEGHDGFTIPAFNARMTDMAAALGVCQMAKLERLLEARRAQAASLTAALATHPLLAPAPVRAFERPNWQSYPARLRDPESVTGQAVIEALAQRGVAARGGLTNAHREPAYTTAAAGRWRALPLPVSERVRKEVIMLPLFAGMTDSERDALHEALSVLPTLVTNA